MYYLVINIQAGELQPPFTDNPPQAPLPTIAHLLVSSGQTYHFIAIPLLLFPDPSNTEQLPKHNISCHLTTIAE